MADASPCLGDGEEDDQQGTHTLSLDELLDAAHRSPEEIIEQILADEWAGELLERAVQEALLAADERKRRALARAVASGLLASDEAAIDEAQTIVRVIGGLEPAHVRMLLVLARPGAPRPAWGVDILGVEIKVSSELAESLIAKLTADGLARDATEFVPMVGRRGGPRWEITELGLRVLALLRSDPPSEEGP